MRPSSKYTRAATPVGPTRLACEASNLQGKYRRYIHLVTTPCQRSVRQRTPQSGGAAARSWPSMSRAGAGRRAACPSLFPVRRPSCFLCQRRSENRARLLTWKGSPIDEEGKVNRGADRLCPVAGANRHAGCRGDLQDGDQRAAFHRWKKLYAVMGVAELRCVAPGGHSS